LVKSFALVGLTAVLSSCGTPTVDDQIFLTKIACLTKAGESFPDLKKVIEAEPWIDKIEKNAADQANAQQPAEVMLPGEAFRMVSTGKFIYKVPSSAFDGAGSLTCTGDFNRQLIETINHKGLDKLPAAGELWSI
jgi:hypothetical protein